jgi:ditrans,polycis-polyprenyl diphosphate synthase
LNECFTLGIEVISLYAFSLENFKRPKEQVDTLMRLLESALLQIHGPNTFVEKHDVQIRVVGRLELLDEDLLRAIARTVDATKDNKGKILNICIAYTGRDEIATAIRDTVSGCGTGKITESSLTDHMFMEVPLDLMIRTSGVYRLSDFMLWQCHQVTPIEVVGRNWPDFGRWDMGVILLRWQRRRNGLWIAF